MTTWMIFACGIGAGAGGLLIAVVLVTVFGGKNAERNREVQEASLGALQRRNEIDEGIAHSLERIAVVLEQQEKSR